MYCLEPKCIAWARHSSNESHESLQATPAIIMAVTPGKGQRMKCSLLIHLHSLCIICIGLVSTVEGLRVCGHALHVPSIPAMSTSLGIMLASE